MIDEQVCETFFQEQEKKRNYEKGIRSDKDPKWERPEALQLLVSPSYLEPQREEHLFYTKTYLSFLVSDFAASRRSFFDS
jgi:hypothetical protein